MYIHIRIIYIYIYIDKAFDLKVIQRTSVDIAVWQDHVILYYNILYYIIICYTIL